MDSMGCKKESSLEKQLIEYYQSPVQTNSYRRQIKYER